MKFAQVGYGTYAKHGEDDQKLYTYLVEDGVRTGDDLIVSVHHYKNQKIFGTTGHISKGGLGRQMPVVEKSNGEALKKEDLEQGYTLKDLGVKKEIGSTSAYAGLNVEDPNKRRMEAIGKAVSLETKRVLDIGKTPELSGGEKTQMSVDYLTKKMSKQYEPYSSYMSREEQSRNGGK